MRATSYYWHHPNRGMPSIDKTGLSKDGSKTKDAGSTLNLKEENMKNLHYLKKFVVMVLAAMMTLSTFALPTFAAAGDATVTGVEDGATVKAYQFITQNENNKWIPATWVGATEVKAGESFKVTDPYDSTKSATFNVTSTEYNKDALAIIANIIRSKTTEPASVTLNGNATNGYKGNLANKGAYLVLVTPPSGKTTVYMPAVISKNLNADEPSLDMTVNIKKETPEPDKNIITKADAADKSYGKGHQGGNSNVNLNDQNKADDTSKKGDTLAAGDITQFEVTSPVPAYSQDYFFTKDNKDVYPMFRVNDTLTNLTLKVGANENKFEVLSVDASGTAIRTVDYVLVENGVETDKAATTLDGKKAFCIRITDKAFLKSGGTLSVRYWATLDDKAVSGFGDKNNNHVKVEYSTKPGQDSGFTEKDIDTYHHTFDIDGEINGSDEGREFVKVKAIDGKIIASEKVTETHNYLAGAVFTLSKGGKVVAVAESAADGRLKAIPQSSANYAKYVKDGVKNGLTKLDAGDYVLNEVVAPEGYALNGTDIPVSIKANIDNTTGKLLSYSVTINGTDTNTYTYDAGKKTFATTYKYKNAAGEIVSTTDADEAKASWETQFENSNVGTLPSTGGIGTVLFTVGGIAIMGLALLLLFGGKKKQHQK